MQFISIRVLTFLSHFIDWKNLKGSFIEVFRKHFKIKLITFEYKFKYKVLNTVRPSCMNHTVKYVIFTPLFKLYIYKNAF